MLRKDRKTQIRGTSTVNIGILVIALVGGLAGILSTFYLLIAMPVVIIQKIYRKVRFGTPIMK